MGLGPTMQVKAGSTAGQRAFNPQRDLVWGIGRLVKRIGEKLSKRLRKGDGTIDPHEYVTLLHENYIYAPSEEAEYLAKDFTRFINALNDYFQRLHGDTEESHEPFTELFAVGRFGAARNLFCLMLTREIFAEHPFWWDQVKPQSPIDPQPDVKVIDDAVRELVGRLAK